MYKRQENAGVIVFIDQIDDGHEALKLLQSLQSRGLDGRRIRMITALCAGPGLKCLGENIPDLTIHTACIDERLDESGRIVPGIGEPSSRLNLRSCDGV